MFQIPNESQRNSKYVSRSLGELIECHLVSMENHMDLQKCDNIYLETIQTTEAKIHTKKTHRRNRIVENTLTKNLPKSEQ